MSIGEWLSIQMGDLVTKVLLYMAAILGHSLQHLNFSTVISKLLVK